MLSHSFAAKLLGASDTALKRPATQLPALRNCLVYLRIAFIAQGRAEANTKILFRWGVLDFPNESWILGHPKIRRDIPLYETEIPRMPHSLDIITFAVGRLSCAGYLLLQGLQARHKPAGKLAAYPLLWWRGC